MAKRSTHAVRRSVAIALVICAVTVMTACDTVAERDRDRDSPAEDFGNQLGDKVESLDLDG